MDLAQLVMIVLTAVGGSAVTINTKYIASLYPTKEAASGKPNELVVKGGRCVVTLSDGKFYTVTEDCNFIRQKIARLR